MSYIAQSDLSGMVPPAFVVEALDDDRDGSADASAWTAVEADAASQIDSRLGGRYTVPFTEPLPALVIEAAKVFCAEALYLRRGQSGDANPFLSRANDLRKRLQAIGAGEMPLSPTAAKTRPPVSVITGSMRTNPVGVTNG